ncbi:MAG: UvrD-helicase domain-containing protein [Bacteroidaceae bacterium]|nr:UvrD-helicase domain-containing protein [Bacteroidaceae bacterium]
MEERKNLEVFRASAGSGKTFILAVKYITLLIKQPDAYKHIVAVTFTNKATGEMKERILSQLYGIAYDLPSSGDYMTKMQEAYPTLSREEISRKAKIALNLIMHDYGHFRIQTIDSFFQSVLRSLAKELELNGDVEFELNGEELLDEAVDTYIKRLEEGSAEIKQIISFIEENLNNNKTWKIDKAIKSFAHHLLKEEYQERGAELRKEIDKIDENGVSRLKNFYNEVKELENEITGRIKGIAVEFFSIAKGTGPNDYFGKTRGGVWGFFNKMREGEIATMSDKIANLIKDWDKISTVAGIDKERIAALLAEAKEIEQEKSLTLNSCRLSLDKYHQLGLLNTIAKTLKEENQRENRFLLAETTYFLSSMITNNTSFIFEKIGTEINHIFIDEFQDTSKLQWNCFKILLDEVIARGNYNLIVGDVKQSIYRWRNSDWNIMNNIETFHPETINIASQDVMCDGKEYKSTNYRSSRRIVGFNNLLYCCATRFIATQFKEKVGKDIEKLIRAYRDVEQAVPEKRGNEGYVEIRKIQKENSLCSMDREGVAQLMKTLHEVIEEKGVPAKDIAILLRGNSIIPDIVEAFKKEFPTLKIVSNEAYRYAASEAVQLIIAAMRHIATPDDDINIVHFIKLYNKIVEQRECEISSLINKEERLQQLPADYLEELPQLKGLPVYELIEKLVSLLHLTTLAGEEAYLFSFLDQASQCTNGKSTDINGFLDIWDEKLCNETIPAATSDSVTVMTIHKSKGLEFPTVIIPFCDWELTGKPNETLWCEPGQAPFNMLSLLPINRQELMLNSIYRNEYNEELLYQIVDNLNILYVATTRAKNNLYIFTDSTGGRGDTMSKLLNGIIKELTALQGSSFDKENGIYRYGEVISGKEKEEKKAAEKEKEKEDKKTTKKEKENPFTTKEDIVMQNFAYYDNRLTFKQSRDLARFLASDKKEQRNYDAAARGELMHSILAQTNTGEELPRLLNKMLIEGTISSEKEVNYIKSKLEKAIADPRVAHWFSGRYRLFNECAILCDGFDKERSSFRPDRVMVDGENVIVVDYKFAKKSTKHLEQVGEYMKLLAMIGYTDIKGYVWYVDRNEIEEVVL